MSHGAFLSILFLLVVARVSVPQLSAGQPSAGCANNVTDGKES